jgi:hypothetical protein
MPYIDNDQKWDLKHGSDPKTAGELTFLLQDRIRVYLEVNGLRYQQIAEVLGSLEGAKLDFIQRVVKPYEDKKRVENGDVWPLTLTGLMGDDDECFDNDELVEIEFTATIKLWRDRDILEDGEADGDLSQAVQHVIGYTGACVIEAERL